MRDHSDGAADAEGASPPDLTAIVNEMRGELAALRRQVAELHAELMGCAVGALYQSVAGIVTYSETGGLEPVAVAERAERFQPATALGASSGAADAVLSQFVKMLRAMPTMHAGTWRAQKPNLRVVKDLE